LSQPRKRGYESGKTGYVGECLVQLELAKRGMRVHKIPDGFPVDCDFLTSTGKRLEVKSSRLGRRSVDGRPEWHFTNLISKASYVPKVGVVSRRVRRKQVRQVDFYILTCLEREGYAPKAFYIIPSKDVGEIMALAVYPEDLSEEREARKSRWAAYLNAWSLLF
jgi:hypothetical protein